MISVGLHIKDVLTANSQIQVYSMHVHDSLSDYVSIYRLLT